MSWIEIALMNAAVALPMAVGAAVASRLVRRPEVAHVLWLLVLAKLLTPPIFQLPVLPHWPERATQSFAETPLAETPLAEIPAAPITSATESVAIVSTAEGVVPAAARAKSAPAPGTPVGIRIWWLGALALALLAAVRMARFGALAARAEPAGEALAGRAERLASRLGLARCPEVRLIDRPVPPLVWAPFGRPRILLPLALLERLEPAELDAILVHELAHVRRRDHWVRLLELAACTLFWWHPAAWWARHSLRQAEEGSCDRWVLRVLPGAARPYAEGLLKTLELTTPTLPAMASGIRVFGRWKPGIHSLKNIEQRLTMIMRHQTERSSMAKYRFLALAAALGALVIFPTWAEHGDEESADREQIEQRLAAERQALELREQRRALEAREMEARHSLHQEQKRLHMEEAKRQADAREAAGRAEEAEEIRREIARAQAQVQLEAERYELERARLMEGGGLELELHRERFEAAALEAAGRHAEAAEARQRMEELADRMGQRSIELMNQEMALRQRHRQAQQEQLTAEAERLRSAGEEAAAEDLTRRAERLRLETRRAEAEHQLRLKQRALELESEQLAALLRREEVAARAAIEAREGELRGRFQDLERDRVRHAVETEITLIREELPLRLRELRRMLEEIDDDGELTLKLDQLETALAAALESAPAE